MRSLKILILALIAIVSISANAQSGYVTPMGFLDYSFYNQLNIGNRGTKLTNPAAYLEIGKRNGSNKGVLFPRGNKDSVTIKFIGLIFEDSASNKLIRWNGIAWEDLGAGSADGNNYVSSGSYASNVLTLNRSGMTPVTVTLPFSSKLNVADTANKWITTAYRRGDSIFYLKGGVENFAFVLSYSLSGLSTEYLRGDNTLGTFWTDVFAAGDTRYSFIGHSHVSADIIDLTPVVRNMFSGDSNINVNNTTGKITFTGAALPGDSNNYVNAASYSNNVLTLGRLGLTPITAAWDSAKYHSMGFYDGRYQPVGPYLVAADIAGKLNIPDTANHWTNNFYKRNDSVFFKKGSTEYFAFIDASGGGSFPYTAEAEEYSSSTSMAISLSYTPASGVEETYYLNGIVIRTSNYSRTATTVTFSGFTRETSDLITAKYYH